MITQTQVPTTQKIQKIVEILQVQFEDEVVYVPVVMTGAGDSQAHKAMENSQVQVIDRTQPIMIQRGRSHGSSTSAGPWTFPR